MNEFRCLAAKIDQHMQQLAAQGISAPHAIINRMMGYLYKLNEIPFTQNSDTPQLGRSDYCDTLHRVYSVTCNGKAQTLKNPSLDTSYDLRFRGSL